MKNTLKILGRDFMRLLKAPAALIVVLVLLVLPSAYSWYNIAGFWNPYNNTSALKVCVVNQDAGGSSDLTGELDIGTRIVDTLKDNTQLNWQFCGYDEAMDMLYSGDAYAVYMIPSTFTEDLLTIVTGELHQPDIVYYVNEKLAPVAPKITDTGATTLDETINSTFVATVANVVVETLDSSVDEAGQKLADAKSQVLDKLETAKSTVADMKSSLQNVEGKASAGSDKIQSTKSALQHVDEELDSTSEQLQTLATRGTDLQNMIADIVGNLNGALIDTDALKDAIQGANGIESAAEKASSAIQAQKTLNSQSIDLMDQLDDILDTSTSASEATTDLLDKIDSQLDSLIVDCRALSTSSIADVLNKSGNTDDGDSEASPLDAQKISNFMAAPTTIVTEQLYYVNSYGAAMAPLFMNLTFWIGAFMLLVIMKQEVDGEGIDHPTAKQRYVARFLFFGILVILQSAICCTGVRVMGVEVVNAPALFLAAACSSFVYLAIIYALSTTLQHIGKGICLVLVFAQIPGATGLYPIEMTSPFFQAVYPLLPFTYGIGAMREAICGFYGNQYIQDIAILLAFGVVFFFAGLLLKPAMANVNKVVANQIEESDIINGEISETPTRPYRLSQIVRALTSRKAYRKSILRRHERFERMYPKIRRASMIVGVIMPIALGIVLAVTPTERVTLITICLVWMIAYFIFLTIVESLRASLNRQLELDSFNDDELKELYNNEKGGRNA